MLRAAFDLSEREVLRNRLLVSEQVLVGVHRTSEREEEARQLARERTRDLEFKWAAFLTRGMDRERSRRPTPRLLARAILGLYNSVFHWYRPRAGLSLAEVADFFVPRCLAVAGMPLEGRRRGPAGDRPKRARAPRARAKR